MTSLFPRCFSLSVIFERKPVWMEFVTENRWSSETATDLFLLVTGDAGQGRTMAGETVYLNTVQRLPSLPVTSICSAELVLYSEGCWSIDFWVTDILSAFSTNKLLVFPFLRLPGRLILIFETPQHCVPCVCMEMRFCHILWSLILLNCQFCWLIYLFIDNRKHSYLIIRVCQKK